MYVVGDRKNCVKKDKDEEGFVGRVWLNRCPVWGFSRLVQSSYTLRE